MHWLEITVTWGFPALPLFEREPWLDPVRKSPEFVSFLARVRPQWEKDRDALLRN